MKHKFTHENRGTGFCGHEYCPGGCYDTFDYVNTCTCSFIYHGKPSKQKELEHVLKAEGLYE